MEAIAKKVLKKALDMLKKDMLKNPITKTLSAKHKTLRQFLKASQKTSCRSCALAGENK